MSTYLVGLNSDGEEIARIRVANVTDAFFSFPEFLATWGDCSSVQLVHSGKMGNGVPRPRRTVWEKP